MKLLFPGTFDPFTIGHASLVERALRLADEVVIAVGVNPAKTPMFRPDERVAAIRSYYQDEPRVSVISYTGLTADIMHVAGAQAILRGVRSAADYDVECNLADANREVLGAETILLVSEARFQHVSSSLCRELAHFGHDISSLVIDTFPKPEK